MARIGERDGSCDMFQHYMMLRERRRCSVSDETRDVSPGAAAVARNRQGPDALLTGNGSWHLQETAFIFTSSRVDGRQYVL